MPLHWPLHPLLYDIFSLRNILFIVFFDTITTPNTKFAFFPSQLCPNKTCSTFARIIFPNVTGATKFRLVYVFCRHFSNLFIHSHPTMQLSRRRSQGSALISLQSTFPFHFPSDQNGAMSQATRTAKHHDGLVTIQIQNPLDYLLFLWIQAFELHARGKFYKPEQNTSRPMPKVFGNSTNISATSKESSLLIDKNERSELGLDANRWSSIEVVLIIKSIHIPSNWTDSLMDPSESSVMIDKHQSIAD